MTVVDVNRFNSHVRNVVWPTILLLYYFTGTKKAFDVTLNLIIEGHYHVNYTMIYTMSRIYNSLYFSRLSRRLYYLLGKP